MIVSIQPYLFFEGRCEEAIAFYREALGAEIEMMLRFRDGPQPEPGQDGMVAPDMGDKVMHATLRVGDATVFLSDGHCSRAANFDGFGLSLSAADPEEAKGRFDALAEGGEIRMPLGETFFSPCFGMVADRFGVLWMVIVPA